MIKTEASISLLLLVGLLPIFNFFIIVLVLSFLPDWLGLLSFVQDCFIHLLRIQLTHFDANSLQGVNRKGWWLNFAPKLVDYFAATWLEAIRSLLIVVNKYYKSSM